MARVYADRVMETTTTTGTGPLTLVAAVPGFQRFADAVAVGDTFDYSIFALDANGAPSGIWETGRGTYSAANTITRTTVQDSSTGVAVDWAAGTKCVMLSHNAASVNAPGGVPEAPNDGQQYARQNNDWYPVEAPVDEGEGGAGKHRYWRAVIFRDFTPYGTVNGRVQELVLAETFAGPQRAVGGTAIGVNGGNYAAAFDGSMGTAWQGSSSNYYQPWVGYDFGAPVQIVEARFSVNGNQDFLRPVSGTFQWSDDGVVWTTLFDLNFTWGHSGDATQAFRDPTYIPPYNDKVPQGGTANMVLTKKSGTDGDTEFRALPMVTLTQAEYDLLGAKDANTYYFIKA